MYYRTPFGLLALHLGLAAIGPGMLTLPYALSNTGIFGGLLILFISYGASVISTIILFEASAFISKRDRTGPPPSYGYLVNQLLDSKWSIILDLSLVTSGIAGSISFLIFFGDFVPPTLKALLHSSQDVTDRQTVIVLTSIICTILGTTDNGVSHTIISLIPVFGFGFCLCLLLYKVFSPAVEGMPLNLNEDLKGLFEIPWTPWRGVQSINLFLFCFLMQGNVLPTFAAVSPVPPSDASILAQIESPILRTRYGQRVQKLLLTDDSNTAALRTASSRGETANGGVSDDRFLIMMPPQNCISDDDDAVEDGAHNDCIGELQHLWATFDRRLGTLRRKTFLQALFVSQTTVLVFYLIIAVLGVILVQRQKDVIMPQNFTRAFPDRDSVFMWLRGILIVSLLVLTPYLVSAVANGCKNLVHLTLRKPINSDGFGDFRSRLAYSAALVTGSAIIALKTDRVATVLSILGGWAATMLMCAVPAVLLIKIGRLSSRDEMFLFYLGLTTVTGFVAAVLPYWTD